MVLMFCAAFLLFSLQVLCSLYDLLYYVFGGLKRDFYGVFASYGQDVFVLLFPMSGIAAAFFSLPSLLMTGIPDTSEYMKCHRSLFSPWSA